MKAAADSYGGINSRAVYLNPGSSLNDYVGSQLQNAGSSQNSGAGGTSTSGGGEQSGGQNTGGGNTGGNTGGDDNDDVTYD